MLCRRIFKLLVIAMVSAAAGCSGVAAVNDVWYKWGKTLEEADDDCRACYYEAVKYARRNSEPYASAYTPGSGPYADYRDRYAVMGHGVGEDLRVAYSDRFMSGARQSSYESLRQRQMVRCMTAKGYRIRSGKSLGENLARRQVPVAGNHWVAGVVLADANSADATERTGVE
jgi:hypothetical protein